MAIVCYSSAVRFLIRGASRHAKSKGLAPWAPPAKAHDAGRESVYAGHRRRTAAKSCRRGGPHGAPVLMLSNSARHRSFHVGRASTGPSRGISGSCATTAAATAARVCRKALYTMERLGPTCSRVLDGLGMARVNWCGLSMGGMVGQWLGANRARAHRQAHPLQHRELLRRQAALGRPHAVRRNNGIAAVAAGHHGALVHQGFPRARA